MSGAGTAELPAPLPLATTTVHPVSLEEATEHVLRWAATREASVVVTPNVDHLVRLEQDGAFREAYARTRLRVVDGVPLLWLLRAVGRPVPGRVNGTDLFDGVCAGAAERGLTMFIAGGLPDVLAAAVLQLRERFPGLAVEGWSPPLGFEGSPDDDELQRRIRAADPDIVCVCVGAPRSEKWAARYAVQRPGTYLCVGSAVDFAAGARRRAPAFMQRNGLEWLHRLAQEPRRLGRRYLVEDRAFVRIALRELRGRGWPSRSLSGR